MGVNALTIDGTTANPEELLRRLSAAAARLSSPSAAVVCVMGQLSNHLETIAAGVRERVPGMCAVVTATEGVFTERGEVEGKEGFACLIHSGKAARLTAFPSVFGPFESAALGTPGPVDAEDTGAARYPAPSGPMLQLFSSFPTGMGEHAGRLGSHRDDLGWFGAVTTTDAPLWTVTHQGQVGVAQAARLEFPGLKTPLLAQGTCCRIVSEPMVVTATAGTTLLELDQTPALVALGKVTSRLAERAWIVLALLPDRVTPMALSAGAALPVPATSSEGDGNGEPVFRPLRGIDPARGALVLKEPLERGTRVAFAVRDDRSSKRTLEDAMRRAKQRLSGTSPRFGIYFEGVGRGRQLYGAPNVELSLIRQSLGVFPVLGSRSALELRSEGRHVVAQAMSGVLALFTNPS
jgi:small ligand-binding sensory domain FIST